MTPVLLELMNAFLNENKHFQHLHLILPISSYLGSMSVLPVLVVTLSRTRPCEPQLAFTGSTQPQQRGGREPSSSSTNTHTLVDFWGYLTVQAGIYSTKGLDCRLIKTSEWSVLVPFEVPCSGKVSCKDIHVNLHSIVVSVSDLERERQREKCWKSKVEGLYSWHH